MAAGKVWLVGAGPGDPGLITLRGVRALENASVVIYDRLVNEAVLNHASPSCERIYAGKLAGEGGESQGEINALLVRLAQEGKMVVRLKGGDPFVFGRGGEECVALAAAGVRYEIVPGVSSAIAAPAYAGIPVTQRGVASSFTVLTGHEEAGGEMSSIRWQELATGADTLVLLMGVQALGGVTQRLLEAGRPANTPAAIISSATLPTQRVVVGQLSDIEGRAREAKMEAPAVSIFGDVVHLRDQLQWFERRPLFGRRVLVTRTRDQASQVRALFEEEGAEVFELPTLEIVDGASPQVLSRVIGALDGDEYSWVIFTSANGARRFLREIYAQGKDVRAFHSSKIAVVGPATADSLHEFGLRADLVPDDYDGESLAEVLVEQNIARRRVLVPRAEAGSPELVQTLRTHGAEVEDLPLYRSEVPRNPDPAVLAKIRAGSMEVVTFASSSAVRNLAKLLGDECSGLKNAVIGCIGPSTAEAAQRSGLTPTVVAQNHTIPGLVFALRDYFSERSNR